MEDMVFHFLFIRRAPVVSDRHNVISGVVVKVIHHATVAIVVDLVVTPVVFGAEVDIGGVDDGDTPKVTRDGIVAQNGLVVFVHAVDADAAAAVHGILFIKVIDELVAFNDGRNGHALLVVAIAAFRHNVIFNQDFGRPCAHKVGNRNAAHMPRCPLVVDFVSYDADGVFTTRT